MGELRGPVGVHAWLEHDLCLTLVGDGELSGYQHHPFGRRVPVLGNRSIGGELEEYIGVRFRWITVENGQTATRRHEGRARPPLELSILRATRQSLLLRRRLSKGPCSDESYPGHQQTLRQPVA